MGNKPIAAQNLIEQVMGGLSIYADTHGYMATTDLLKGLAEMLRQANRNKTMADVKHFKEAMMTRKTHTIEVKFDSEDVERHKAVRMMMRKLARTALIQAHLLADDRAPQAMYRNEDFFEGGTLEDLGEEFDDSAPLTETEEKGEG